MISAAGGLFDGGLFDETPMETADAAPLEPTPGTSATVNTPGAPVEPMQVDSEDDMGGPPSIGGSSGGPPSPLDSQPPVIAPETNDIFNAVGKLEENNMADQTTLIQNEEESFALAPIETPVAKGKKKIFIECNTPNYDSSIL